MEPQTITLDGVQYDLAIFSEEVKRYVGLYNIWQKEMQELRLKLIKDEYAISELNRKLVDKMKQEIAAQAQPSTEEEVTVEAATTTE
jgi:recombinational DNA repair protein RecR